MVVPEHNGTDKAPGSQNDNNGNGARQGTADHRGNGMPATPEMKGDSPKPAETQETKRNWEWVGRAIELAFLGCLVVVGAAQVCIYTRQAGIMENQAKIALRQNEIAVQSSRAIVFAKEVRVEKKDGPIPGKPGQFEASWWFSPLVENGGNTSTKNMRIGAQAAFDPSRPEIEVKLPLGMALGAKQAVAVSHLPEAGPVDPEEHLIEAEKLERLGKPSYIIRTILGPHVPQAIAGFGVPIEETKQRVQEGARWFLLGAIHYDDRFSNSSTRLSKYCFTISFEIKPSGDLSPTTSPCPHWNCADEECENDKTAYDSDTAN